MIIDCESCEVRGIACGDCVIGVLLGTPAVPAAVPVSEVAVGPDGGFDGGSSGDLLPSGASTVQFDAAERRALELLAAQGLIPRLRLVAKVARRASERADSVRPDRDAV